MQTVINAINELAAEVGKSPVGLGATGSRYRAHRDTQYAGGQRYQRSLQDQIASRRAPAKLDEIKSRVLGELIPEGTDTSRANQVKDALFALEAKMVRSQILNGEPRIDGRDTRTVRPITIRTGVLPRSHGSALFTRGETQALVVATLGTGRDEQIIDALQGEYTDRFMLHYNMPPYATGETGRVGTPKRREIGHGRLAKRALLAVLPSAGRIRLHHPRGFRNHRIQRFQLDGFGMRRLSGADGRRRAAEGARGGYRHGPDQGRQPLCRADRHSG